MDQQRKFVNPEPRVDADFEYEQAGTRWRFEASSLPTGDGMVTLWRNVYEYDPDDDTWYLDGVVTQLSDDPAVVAEKAATALHHFLEVAGGRLSASEHAQLDQAAAALAAHSQSSD